MPTVHINVTSDGRRDIIARALLLALQTYMYKQTNAHAYAKKT